MTIPGGASLGAVAFHMQDGDAEAIYDSHITNPTYYHEITVDGDERDTGLPILSNEAGIGYSTNELGTTRCVLFESPPDRSGLFSIGQLMHTPLFYNNTPAGTVKDQLKYQITWGRFDNLKPAYAIGNSKADPYIPLDARYVDWTDYTPTNAIIKDYNNIQGRHYDESYLLNDALWDRYFFSTLPSTTSREPANERLQALRPTETTALSAQTSAAEFVVDGAFNVNSTSESAWRAVLAAFFGESLSQTQAEGSP